MTFAAHASPTRAARGFSPAWTSKTGTPNHTGRRAGEEKAPIGIGLRQARPEPPITQRERARERVVERQVVAGPIPHGDGPARTHEAVVPATVVREMARVPVLSRVAVELARA